MLFKKELLVTQDAQKYYDCMNILRENKIPFTQKVTYSESRYGPQGKRFVIDRAFAYKKPFYYIFVSKKYLNDAIYLINKR